MSHRAPFLTAGLWMTAALSTTLVPNLAEADSPPVRTHIAAGDLEGRSEDGVVAYKGIPYAAPPVGPLRWRAPQAVGHWNGVHDASRFGPMCSQPDPDMLEKAERKSDDGWTIFYGISAARGSSEDCLTLNVWAPATTKKAPVIVFLHGASGSSSQPMYDGTAFARDGVVLVSVNFRMFQMGNFSHPALTASAPRNEPLTRYDFMDQMAALRWVQVNIAKFGGDPRNVTLMGSSAGAAAALHLLVTPQAKGLFHKAIIQSGNGWWSPLSHTDHERFGSMLVAQGSTPGAGATSDGLRALAPDALPYSSPHGLDGRLWKIPATELIGKGFMMDIPMIVGWNSLDGSSLRFSPEEVIRRTPPNVMAAYADEGKTGKDLALALYTDSHNGAPARWVAAKAEGGAPVWLYQFSYVFSPYVGRSRGAEHGLEIPHVFDSWGRIPAAAPWVRDRDRQMTRLMHECWVNFAKVGIPTCAGAPQWPRYRRSEDALMEFTDIPVIRRGLRQRQLDAWEGQLDAMLAEQHTSLMQLLDATHRTSAATGEHNAP
jgi:para-nitrobenzyl esterase